jgi:hypothetical protein
MATIQENIATKQVSLGALASVWTWLAKSCPVNPNWLTNMETLCPGLPTLPKWQILSNYVRETASSKEACLQIYFKRFTVNRDQEICLQFEINTESINQLPKYEVGIHMAHFNPLIQHRLINFPIEVPQAMAY